VYGYGMRRKLSFSLGKYIRVFQAEMYATTAYVIENRDKSYKNSNI
jgi:hypothetical protein